jgi:hypothetical protein
VAAGNLISEVQIVTIGGEGWMTNLFTGRWEPLPGGWEFDPAAFFAPETGIPNLLTDGLEGIAVAGPLATEELEGENWRLTGQAQPAQLVTLSGGLFPPAPADVEAWIDPITNLIYQMQLVLPESDSEEPTEWLLILNRYGEDVTIEPPL